MKQWEQLQLTLDNLKSEEGRGLFTDFELSRVDYLDNSNFFITITKVISYKF